MSSNTHGNTHDVRSTAVAAKPAGGTKMIIIAVFIVGAFLLSYNFAAAQSRGTADALGSNAALATGGVTPSGAGSSAGGGCCGGGGPAVEGATTVAGDVQTIAVDTSAGTFNPGLIRAKAGVPIEITFSQSPGGCLSGVVFPDFNIGEDLTGGAKTIKLPALQPGEYQFFCQMQMVSGTIVVE